jgi:TolB protein
MIAGCLLAACSKSPPQPGRSASQPGILFTSDRDGNWEIYQVQPDGSGLKRLTDHPEVDADAAWSPDASQIAFRSRRDGSSDIYIMAADGSRIANLIADPVGPDDEFAPAWNPDGRRLAIYTDRFPGRADCSIHQLAWLPVGGGAENIQLASDAGGSVESFAWSPDGKSLVYKQNCGPQTGNLFVLEVASHRVQQLTQGEYGDFSPAWSPDGRTIAFASKRDGNYEIYLLEIASGLLKRVTDYPSRDWYPSWSPDGAQLAFTSDREGNDEIYVLDLQSGSLRNLTNNPARDFRPAWSPMP